MKNVKSHDNNVDKRCDWDYFTICFNGVVLNTRCRIYLN